jgi:hypothetical protein
MKVLLCAWCLTRQNKRRSWLCQFTKVGSSSLGNLDVNCDPGQSAASTTGRVLTVQQQWQGEIVTAGCPFVPLVPLTWAFGTELSNFFQSSFFAPTMLLRSGIKWGVMTSSFLDGISCPCYCWLLFCLVLSFSATKLVMVHEFTDWCKGGTGGVR